MNKNELKLVNKLFQLWENLAEAGQLTIGEGFGDNFKELGSKVAKLNLPDVIDCSTCKHRKVSKYIEPCHGCRDNDGYDNYES